MAPLSLAQVGCGGMGLRHVYGLMELRTQGFDVFDLVALCDKQLSAVEHVASEAERVLGKRQRPTPTSMRCWRKNPVWMRWTL